jgi:hypothetical protein
MGQGTIGPTTTKPDPPPPPLAARGGRRGRATRRMDPARPCLNCGDETTGRYCPTCGQRKTDIQVSLRTLVADALEDELTLDRRLPATLGALFLEPGQLTVDYVNGRVARYVRPVRLYLVSSIIFFLVLSFLSLNFLRDVMRPAEGEESAVVEEGVTAAQIDAQLAAVQRALDEPGLPGPAMVVLQANRDRLLRQRAALDPASTDGPAPGPDAAPGAAPGATPGATPGGAPGATPGGAPGATPGGAPDAMPGVEPAAALDARSSGWAEAMASLEASERAWGHPAIGGAVQAKARQFSRMEPREAAERLAADFLRYAPTVMFILLPVFALVLKALYIRRRRFYAEHFIFLLHTHAFIFLQFTVLLLLVLPGWTPGWLVGGIIGWMILYTYLAMKRVYGQGWLKTLLKWWTLGWAYFWILVFTIPVAFLATALLA